MLQQFMLGHVRRARYGRGGATAGGADKVGICVYMSMEKLIGPMPE